MKKARNEPQIPKWDIATVQEKLRAHRDEVKADIIEESLIVVDDFSQLHILEETCQTQMTVIGYCSSGSCTLRINMKDYEIRPNDLLCILPEQWISLVKSDNFHCSFVIMTAELSMQLLPKVQNLYDIFLFLRKNPCIHLDDAEINLIRSYQAFLKERHRDPHGMFMREIQQHLLMSLLYELCDIAGRVILQQHDKPMNRKEEYAEQFLLDLSMNYRRERGVGFYAERLHITPKYLSGIVKEVSGRHATEWIEEVVISEAKNMLTNSSLTIQEISNELNFCNQSFFGKYFKEHTGQSPKSFRAAAGKAS